MAVRNTATTASAGVSEPEKATSEPVEEIVISEEDTTTTKKKFIKYVGDATNRVISKADWDSLGLKAESVEWSLQNDFRLPSEDFTEQQLTYLLKVDGRFKAADK